MNDFQEKSLKSLQYQILDAFKLFLHSWNQLKPDNPLIDSMESGLRLPGSAFANISKLRRANVMRNVAPNLSPLLKDPKVFSSRESERLFGDKFIDAMVKKLTLMTKWPKLHAVAVRLATSIVLVTLIGAVATAIKTTMVVGDKAVALPTETGEAPKTKQASRPIPEPNNMANSSIIGM